MPGRARPGTGSSDEASEMTLWLMRQGWEPPPEKRRCPQLSKWLTEQGERPRASARTSDGQKHKTVPVRKGLRLRGSRWPSLRLRVGTNQNWATRGLQRVMGAPAFIQLQCLFVFARPLKALHSQLVPGQGAPRQLRAATAAGSTQAQLHARRHEVPAAERADLDRSIWKGRRFVMERQVLG